jgi:hypothetical protein
MSAIENTIVDLERRITQINEKMQFLNHQSALIPKDGTAEHLKATLVIAEQFIELFGENRELMQQLGAANSEKATQHERERSTAAPPHTESGSRTKKVLGGLAVATTVTGIIYGGFRLFSR